MTLPLDIEYNPDLDELVALLGGVERSGDFFTSGARVAPMPGLTVSGVGKIAFPLLPAQASAIAKVAEPAPHGRGEETLVDRKVRDARQLAPGKFRLTGKSWPETLERIVEETATGLGCLDFEVKAELYKLVLYEEGGFFLSHRDTEKARGMFGTLVIALPAEHRGGELVIRHGKLEATVSLKTEDDSELRHAAFYADCEHEVLPVEKGSRLCLIYNLIRGPVRKEGKKTAAKTAKGEPKPPDYTVEVERATGLLEEWRQNEERSFKVAYLLSHEYTPEGLSFSGLKLQDSARAKVLAAAAARARMTLHLGIVHIAEYGLAEVYGGYGYGRPSRRYWDDDEEADDDEPDDYELIEAYDGERTIGEWVDLFDRRVDFGALPLADEELIPQSALDNDPPDRIRVSEATGNEGGSYERFYFRAALVFWPEEATEDVLLQAGAPAVVPHLEKLLGAPKRTRNNEAIRRLARKITTCWPANRLPSYTSDEHLAESAAPRVAMLNLLVRFGDPALIADFIRMAIGPLYHGTENATLCKAFALLPSAETKKLAVAITEQNGCRRFSELVGLLAKMVTKPDLPARAMAEALVKILRTANFGDPKDSGFVSNKWEYGGWGSAISDFKSYSRRYHPSKIDHPAMAKTLARFIGTLHRISKAEPLIRECVAALVESPGSFPSDEVLCPLADGLKKKKFLDLSDPKNPLAPLWFAAAKFLLDRSGDPPAKPADWTLRDQTVSCRCAECVRLMKFAKDPEERVARFPLNKERRMHLHRAIDEAGLELRHETERKGRPFTLVLTKTRWRHEVRLAEYAEDLKRMKILARIATSAGSIKAREIAARLTAAGTA